MIWTCAACDQAFDGLDTPHYVCPACLRMLRERGSDMTDKQVIALARDDARRGRSWKDMPGMSWEQGKLYLQAHDAEDQLMERVRDESVRRWIDAHGMRSMAWILSDMRQAQRNPVEATCDK